MRTFLRLKLMLLAFVTGGTLCTVPTAFADEQFIPLLVYRSGPYAPNGVPFANGFVDYLNLIDAREGGSTA